MAYSSTVAAGGLHAGIDNTGGKAPPPAGGRSIGGFRVYVAPGFGRLWVASVFVPIVALVLGGIWTWDNVVDSKESEMRRTLDMVNGQVMSLLETQEAVMAGMQAFVAPMSYAEMLTSEPAHVFAMKIAEKAKTVITLGVVEPGGHITVPSEAKRPPPQVNLASRDYAQAWKDAKQQDDYRMFISPVVINQVIKQTENGRIQLQIHTSLPRIGADGRPDGGIVTAAFGPVQIERFFEQVAETKQTGFSILRDEGDLDHARIVANYPVNLHVEKDDVIEPVNIAADDIARDAILELNAKLSDPHAKLTAAKRETGTLFHNFQLVLVRRVGAETDSIGASPRKDYPLDIIHRLDPVVAQEEWMREMFPVLIGVVAAMTLLLVLTSRAQATTLREQAELRARTEIAEEGQRLATERAEMESRLRQTEKVAALGQLAAGVAHDFNNLLQTIILNGELLAATAAPESSQARSAGLIIRASEGGIALTRRMLDYTRRDDDTSRELPFDPAAALRSVQALLSSSLGTRHRLRVALPPDLPQALGGDAEFESVIINLVVNARDAMENGGDILVEAAAVNLADGSRADLLPGRYVRISVIDTGKGMDMATLTRAGEAFFTTKERGRGTGLGLSMARGFARRSGGALDLASTPGQGTTVTVWLPVAA